jgi:hypothetical protein
MLSIIEDPSDPMRWKKFFLLPTVLFTTQTNRKGSMNNHLELLNSDNWDSLFLNSFPRKIRSATASSQTSNQKCLDSERQRCLRNNSQIKRLIEAGEFSDLFKFLRRSSRKIECSLSTLEALKSKHPSRVCPIIQDQTSTIPLSVSTQHTLNITGDKVRQIIRNRKRLKRPGIDKLSFDHLRQLVGYGGDKFEKENAFAFNLGLITALLLDFKAPISVYDFLRDNELCAIPKGESDVRPIGMGNTIRKICSTLFLSHTHERTEGSSFNERHFKDLQFGLAENGCEKIIHRFRLNSQLYPDRDMFFADAENAFNRISRAHGLREVKTHFPFMFPFVSQIYGKDSNGWFIGDSSVLPIKSSEGYHQGDVLGSWLFCLTIQPLLEKLRMALSPDELIMFFIDDGNFEARFETMLLILEILVRDGPAIGFHLSKSKGVYLMGRCGDPNLAAARKFLLISRFGMNPSIIRVHPEDGGDPLIYGARVVGGFIGSEEFIQANLLVQVERLSVDTETIKSLDSLQARYFLLKWCFCQRALFLQRVTPPSLINRVITSRFEVLKSQILASILGIPIESLPIKYLKLAALSVSNSGIGLGNSNQISHAAFLASFFEAVAVYITAESLLRMNVPVILEVLRSIEFVKKYDPEFSFDSLLSFVKKGKEKIGSQTVQGEISKKFEPGNRKSTCALFLDPREIAWIESLHDPDAGAWLEIAPKTSLHRMLNRTFQMALTLRLFLPQKDLLPGMKCTCGLLKKCPIDLQGVHFCTGCNLEGVRNRTHDRVRDLLLSIFSFCGIGVVKEQRHSFRGDDPECGMRSDITLFGIPTRGPGTYHVDVRITSPVPANRNSGLTSSQASSPFRAGNKSVAEKNHKYRVIVEKNQMKFIPIVFEITGRMDPNFRELLREVLRFAADVKQSPFSSLWIYWTSALMTCLQRNLIEGIQTRAFSLNGRSFRESVETSRTAIREIEYRNVGVQDGREQIGEEK